jgi:predicted nucleotidyltransferase
VESQSREIFRKSGVEEMMNYDKIKEALQNIAPKYEISKVYLFGSYARGDATDESDLDFRIVGGNIRTLFDVAKLHLDLEDAFGKPTDVVLTKNMEESFYQVIKDEEVLVYGRV